MSEKRRPRSLYGVGSDPDPRFTLANERTLLAWIRTALAFAAAGLALLLLIDEFPNRWSSVLPATAFAIALVIVLGALIRWYRTERALRIGAGLPAPWLGAAIVAALAVGFAGGIAAALIIG